MEMEQADSLSVFGIVIPPSKVESLCEASGCKDKGSKEYQILSWNALAAVIEDLVRNVNPQNMKQTVAHLFAENIIRGKALFCASCMKYQTAWPEKSFLYAALTALVNSRFPAVGSLVMRRLFGQFVLAIQKNDCPKKNPDYVKVAVDFFKEPSLPAYSFTYMHDRRESLHKRFLRCMNKYKFDQDVVNTTMELLAIWDSIFDGSFSVCPELEWTLSDLDENDRVDMIIFQDDFKYDPIFVERETAFEFFKRFVLLLEYWKPGARKVTC